MLKARHSKQLLCYDPPSATYQPLHYALALQTDCLTLMLPSAVALEVLACRPFTLLQDFPSHYRLCEKMHGLGELSVRLCSAGA